MCRYLGKFWRKKIRLCYTIITETLCLKNYIGMLHFYPTLLSFLSWTSLCGRRRRRQRWTALCNSPVAHTTHSAAWRIAHRHAYFPFSGFNGVSSAVMINNKSSRAEAVSSSVLPPQLSSSASVLGSESVCLPSRWQVPSNGVKIEGYNGQTQVGLQSR